MVAVFELVWRQVAENEMPTLTVVEGLDILENGGPGFAA
jgi:hypothetical protein